MVKRPPGYFDASVYPQFRALSVSLLHYFRPEPNRLKLERDLFLTEQKVNPTFSYDRMSHFDAPRRRTELNDFMDEVVNDRHLAPLVRTLYRRIVQQELRKLDLLDYLNRLLQDRDDLSALAGYQDTTRLLYGQPICSLFLHVIEVLALKVSNSSPNQDNEYDYESARFRLESLIKHYDGVAERCPLLLKTKPSVPLKVEAVISDETELWRQFVVAIEELGLMGWKLSIDETGIRTTFAVSLGQRLLKAPGFKQLTLRSRDKAMTPSMVKGLVAHELATHARRYERGLESPLNLLATGLDLYEQGAEGLATYREQQATGTDDYAGFTYYLAAGLACGLMSESRDFRSTFDFLADYYVVHEGATRRRARLLAWEATLRVFRGTPGDVSGLIFTKDVVYREGNTMAWEFFPALRDESSGDLDVGKFDPTNREHVRILTELELISTELSTVHDRLCLPSRSDLLLCYPEYTANIVKS